MKPKTSIVLSALALSVAPAFGNGFYVPVQAAEATSRGNAWLATADSAAAVYYNAAGLTQLERPEVSIGAYSIRLGLEADLDSGADSKANSDWEFLPQIYGATPLTDKLVLGYGVNTPFGLVTDWGETSQFRTIATETELTYVTGWLVAGYKLTDTWSVGGGIGVHYADLQFGRNAVVAPGVDVPSEFNGSDEALSWTVSTRWQPAPEHAFGLVYRSKTEFDLEGDVTIGTLVNESAKCDFITPATAAAGYAYSPCKEWTFELNVEWVNWDELNTLTLEGDAVVNQPISFNWNSNFIYSVGATRYFDNAWNASVGYNFIENSMPDSTFTPGVADANRHWLNAGVGQRFDDFKWNFAYQYAFSDHDVSGSPGGLADGNYKSRFHGLMLNCAWQF